MKYINLLFGTIIFLLMACSCNQPSLDAFQYPPFKSKKNVNEYFGREILDEYQELENIDSPKVKKWFNEQKDFYYNIINDVSGKDSLMKEIERLEVSSNIRAAMPRASDNSVFFRWRFIKENSWSVMSIDSIAKSPVEIFSTTDLTSFKKTAYSLDYCEPSFDGNFAAVGISAGGDEMSMLCVLDTKNKKLLADSIERCMYGNPNWIRDGSGFFYNQLRETQKTEAMYENSVVKFHAIGTDATKDIEIFSKSMNKALFLNDIDFPYLLTFPSSNIVLAQVYRGTNNYAQFYYASLSEVLKKPSKAKWSQIAKVEDKVTSCGLFGDKLFALSFKNNSNGQIEEIDVQNPEQRRVIFQGESLILQEMILNKKAIYVKYLKDGLNGLIEINLTDQKSKEVDLPFKGSISLSSDDRTYHHTDFLYVGLESWVKEFAIYKYDGKQFSLTGIRPPGENGNPSYLTSKEVLVPSHDGTLIPLSIIHHKDLKLDGQNPTILSAYGAYGTIMNPTYTVNRLVWFERSGVYAVAHVRGGGENGDHWYKGGYKATKSNSWKDFIACAEYLIKSKYTTSAKLSAQGGSAGAITVGRAITERPELFKSAIIRVGELNTVRSEKSKNTLSLSEYGSDKDSLEFQYLYNMDVYHHIKKGIKYPSMLFTTGMKDARVDPWQPAKVVAKLQQMKDLQGNITLFRISDEGHFGSSDYIKELGESYTFLFWQLGHPSFKYVKQ